MKLQFIALATVLAFSGGAFAQSATDSNTSGSSGSSYGSTPSSSCDSLTGAEKTQCLRDQASTQNSRPSEVPASTGASTSTDSKPSDSSSSSGGTSDTVTSDSPSTSDTSKPKD